MHDVEPTAEETRMPTSPGAAAPLRARTWRRTLAASGVVTVFLAAACGGGPAGMLYDLIAEGSENAEVALENLENARGEIEEATSGEDLPPCADEYQRPEGMHWRPRYADRVPVPEGIDTDPSSIAALLHRITCRENTPSRLGRVRTLYETMVSSLTEFDAHADTMREAIDRMDNADLEGLAEEIEAIAAARPDEDTFQQRFERLRQQLMENSPLVREVRLNVERNRDVVFAIPVAADEAPNMAEDVLSEVEGHMEEHEVARRYLQDRYDYRRQIYEGPDAGAEP